ncbi:exoribonuclease II [Aspergillus nidulans FGSC A4]|uniref:Mitochondrial exoribonuclease Cyt-4, putative (AFU_orthologue AFUA_7G01550) n=1 Tax=Emericella nidulans (strain FGSC A4 / ATCC 38163 / CBS 112.46 / NRRL 194 / M139) TaxID=227321 RepID=C8VK46_EMENI|nr:exoribonuclease II [Aspergillus nidulans FGSC A4]CBF82444.1 TPA: mitochondrial exoribonuclease Cyt-4, putative (AFU_orthologue; AFUA_7G01550) [Aspergillus nidulans FGSC A4]
MPLTAYRARISGRATGPGFVKLGHSTSVARSCPAALSRLAARPVIARRYNSNETQSSVGDSLRKPQSIDDIRLQTEFEKNKDIRDYLRKWQEITPNTLDPVRNIELSESSQPWTGNMFTFGSDLDDAVDDKLRLTDEDMSGFAHIADEGEGVYDYLQPGDLVVFRMYAPFCSAWKPLTIGSSHEILRYGIYVRSINKQHQFYTHRGKWRIADTKDVDFVVRGFVSPKSVRRLHPYFPDTTAELLGEIQSTIEGGVPREAGARLLEKLNEFDAQVQALYRANSIRFDNIYEVVAHPEKQLQMTLDELACEALEIEPDQINDVIRYVVHRSCRQFPFLIDNDRSSLFTFQYVIFPTSVATMLTRVTTWVREHQSFLVGSVTANSVKSHHPMVTFIQKAQRLIRQSRVIRSPTVMACVGPSAQRFALEGAGISQVVRKVSNEAFTSFNDNDKLIIRFLQLWCIPPKRMKSAALQSAGSHIMRATGMYSAMELNSGSAPLFLQELGVFAPWENLRLLDQDLNLSPYPPTSDQKWSQFQGETQSSRRNCLGDAMAALRKDWGELPVYCVDAIDAQEIDDGISLERIPGSDSFWIHVHVANPSSYLNVGHRLIEYAAARLQTLYVPERTYPILPPSLTQEHFSLAPGRPCLTFSAKLNLQGQVLESNVTNGVVRNVKYITHDKLRSVFGVEADSSMKPLTVGGKMPERSRPDLQDTLSPEDENTFHTLRQLMLGFREYRRKNGAMEWPNNINTPVSMTVGRRPLDPPSIEVTHGGYYIGDPIIQLCPQKIDPHEVLDLSKHDLVSLLMNLACWVSAKWLAERNIPAVYDGTNYHPEYPPLTRENMSEYGGQGFFELAAPRGVSSSRPIHHIPLGLDAYVKSTSPLRRYSDLLAHYQIEAALRFEHEHGRRLDASNPDDAKALPFSHEDVEEHISRSRWKKNRLRAIDHGSKQFWACMLLFRAFYFAECALPETFECLVHRPFSQTAMVGTQYDNGFLGAITSLGVRCAIIVPPEVKDVDVLSVVEAKITSVNLARCLVTVQATRLVKPFKRVGEWA